MPRGESLPQKTCARQLNDSRLTKRGERFRGERFSLQINYLLQMKAQQSLMIIFLNQHKQLIVRTTLTIACLMDLFPGIQPMTI